MVYVSVQCPYCQSTESSRRGSKLTGTSAIGVKTSSACGGSFSSNTRIEAACLESDRQVVDMAITGELARLPPP